MPYIYAYGSRFLMVCDFFFNLFPNFWNPNKDCEMETRSFKSNQKNLPSWLPLCNLSPPTVNKKRRDKQGVHIFWLTNINYLCFSDFTQYNGC